MDTRLVRGGWVVDGYLFVGGVCWQHVVQETGIFGEGPYLHGYKTGTVLAISGEAKDDGHGAFPCVFLRVKKDCAQGDGSVMTNEEKEIEIDGEINMKGVSDVGIVLMHDPGFKYEVFLQGEDVDDEVIRRIRRFADNHGLILK